MYSLFRKEITSFFGSLTGYLVAFVFLIGNGLFLWVFPGNYNIPDSGYASLDGYFSLAPWIFLFLAPALTMRLFAEEKRLGTMEILVTRPLSLFQLVWAKYLAGHRFGPAVFASDFGLFLLGLSAGQPSWQLGFGAAWGSLIGLFLSAAAYVAIGLFASAITDNPVFAFLVALLLSFSVYMGFEFAASLNWPPAVSDLLLQLGINEHYLSVSRGVVDSRDLVYFIALGLVFLVLTSLFLQRKQKKWKLQSKKLGLLLLALILAFLFSSAWFFRIDLTSEKRYSLSPISKQLIQELDAPVKIDAFLDGELPPGFSKLQQAIVEKVQDINAYADVRCRYELIDPYQASQQPERANPAFRALGFAGSAANRYATKAGRRHSHQTDFPGSGYQVQGF